LQKKPKIRADELLVSLGMAPSRTAARALIMAGKVRSGADSVVSKPAVLFPVDTVLVVERPPRFVSRGGEKLARALEYFEIKVNGSHALDVGASTGGFTDCLLQAGAADVLCVDVGHGQLHQKLRTDPRVISLEKINARNLHTISLPRDTFDVVVMDLSFISLTKVLESVWGRVAEGGVLVALIKPQFEAEREEADKGAGIIRDPAVHARVVAGVTTFITEKLAHASVLGVVPSPIEGGDGNREFLVGIRHQKG
jgi:23S rRNA (cytidine1920-2'-O)/16S rRNA (cytidine1409-2'-O)-methyltransferase